MGRLRKPSPPTAPDRRGCGRSALACAGVLLLALALGLGPSRPAAAHATTPAPAASAHATATVTSSTTSGSAQQHWFRGYTGAGQRTVPGQQGVTGAAGTIVVPSVSGGPSDLWVGVSSGPTLVQAGILVDGNPVADYAWLATCDPGRCLPHPAPAPDVVHPGDHIRVTIAWVSGTRWTITVSDLTEHWVWRPTVRPAPAPGWQAQGLWVLEWGPAGFRAGGFRVWWPSITWRGRTIAPVALGEDLGPGCVRLARLAGPGTPFTFANCPA